MEALIKIQSELKAPKGQFNSFGNYKYRNCEDILEALKPLLRKYNCSLVISDSIEMVGDRFYVKATATIIDEDWSTLCDPLRPAMIDEDAIKKTSTPIDISFYRQSCTAYARETLEKKGMDASQITGASSSYARKYALNGLFLIDDTRDADSQEPEHTIPAKKVAPAKPQQATGVDMVKFRAKIMQSGTDSKKLVENYGVLSIDELTQEQLIDADKKMDVKIKQMSTNLGSA